MDPAAATAATGDSGRNDEVAFEYLPFIRTYKDGRVERLLVCEHVPPSVDPTTGVSSKDVVFQPNSGVSARIFLPKLSDVPSQKKKLPVLIYFHGGYMCIESAFSILYHSYLKTLVSQANIIAVAVEYRLAPENPLPVAYEDSYAALQWVASHAEGGSGSEPWLADHADLEHLFLAGDSAGANISHNLAMRAGKEGLAGGVGIEGVVLVHPYFWGTKPVRSETRVAEERAKMESMWTFVCPSSPGNDDPRINPVAENAPSLAGLGCKRVLVFVAEKDFLKERGWLYYEKLGESGWGGRVEIVETEGEDHVFHLFNPASDKAFDKMKRLVSFFNQ